MSEGKRRVSREGRRHLCAACRARKAKFQYRGEVRADRQHVLCFQCFRSARERLRAWQIREGVAAGPPARAEPEASPLRATRPSRPDGGRAVIRSDRQLEHRRAMLAHLERQAVSAG